MTWESELETDIYKAKFYVNEPERVKPCNNGWTFQGDNNDHLVRNIDGKLVCNCGAFRRKPPELKSCAHTRAMEQMGLIPKSEPLSLELALPTALEACDKRTGV